LQSILNTTPLDLGGGAFRGHAVVVEPVTAAEWRPKPVIRCSNWELNANRGRPHFEIIILLESSSPHSHDAHSLVAANITALCARWYQVVAVILVLLAATLRWFTAGGAIRIAVRQLSQTWKLRHYDVITRKL